MRRMGLVAVLVAVALPMSVASATSLGTFDDVVLTGVAQDMPDCAPVLDSLTLATAGVGGLSLTLVPPTTPITLVPPVLGWDLDTITVALSGLGPDCVGMRPVVYVVGTTTLPATEILARYDLSTEVSSAGAQSFSDTGTFVIDAIITIDAVRVVMQPGT